MRDDRTQSVAADPHSASDGQARPLHITRRLLIHPISEQCAFIFNPLSGSLDLATADEVRLLQQLQSDSTSARLSSSVEMNLRERRLAFDSADEEERYLEQCVQSAWEVMQSSLASTFTICPTAACNLACAYCFEGDSLTEKPQGVMTPNQVDLVFRAIDAIRSRNGRERNGDSPDWISLFGGEPFLPSTRRAVDQILHSARDGGYLVSATTNGVNITRFGDLLTEFANILPIVQVTLDGPQEVHDARRHRLGGQGTFREIVCGIDLLLSLGIEVDIRVNTDDANIDSLPDLCDFIEAKGWPQTGYLNVAVAPVSVRGSSGCASQYNRALSELDFYSRLIQLMEHSASVRNLCDLRNLRHLEHLVNILEPGRSPHRAVSDSAPATGPRFWYCEAPTGTSWVFTPDGLISTCTEAVAKPQHAIGRFDPSFELWSAPAARWLGRTILSNAKCRSCSISTLCGGGCHFGARERAAGDSETTRGLVQIELTTGSRSSREGTEKAVCPPSPMAETAAIDPFCNQAQSVIASYLSQQGCQLLKQLITQPVNETIHTA